MTTFCACPSPMSSDHRFSLGRRDLPAFIQGVRVLVHRLHFLTPSLPLRTGPPYSRGFSLDGNDRILNSGCTRLGFGSYGEKSPKQLPNQDLVPMDDKSRALTCHFESNPSAAPSMHFVSLVSLFWASFILCSHIIHAMEMWLGGR